MNEAVQERSLILSRIGVSQNRFLLLFE